MLIAHHWHRFGLALDSYSYSYLSKCLILTKLSYHFDIDIDIDCIAAQNQNYRSSRLMSVVFFCLNPWLCKCVYASWCVSVCACVCECVHVIHCKNVGSFSVVLLCVIHANFTVSPAKWIIIYFYITIEIHTYICWCISICIPYNIFLK